MTDISCQLYFSSHHLIIYSMNEKKKKFLFSLMFKNICVKSETNLGKSTIHIHVCMYINSFPIFAWVQKNCCREKMKRRNYFHINELLAHLIAFRD